MEKGCNRIGQFVRDWRLRHGLTQEEMGKRLGYQNGQMVSNIERAVAKTPKVFTRRMMAVLNRSEMEQLAKLLELAAMDDAAAAVRKSAYGRVIRRPANHKGG